MLPAASVTFEAALSVAPAARTFHVPGETTWYELTLANASLPARTCFPAVTVTWCCCSDAWITRTSALPRGVVSLSRITCKRRPDDGPIPATVYASPDATSTLVERTGLELGEAPAKRMATV